MSDTEIEARDIFLTETADAIRRLAKNVVRDVVDIGRRLTEAKARCGHGNWLQWLKREFDWSERTARHFMGVYELSETANFADLEPLNLASLYLLASPSTPESVRVFVQEVGASMDAYIDTLGEHQDAAAAVNTLLRFRQFAKKLDVAAVRSYLTESGCGREFFEAISLAVSLRRALDEPRAPRPDYLRPIE
jgi:hypothetical protein